MKGAGAYMIINRLQKKWQNQQLLVIAIFALAIAIPAAVLLNLLIKAEISSLVWIIPLCFVLLIGLLLVLSKWKVSELQVIRLLNEEVPGLEQSTGLLLKEPAQLGMLEALQVRKISSRLESIDPPAPSQARLKRSLIYLICGLIAAALISFIVPALSGKLSGSDDHTLSAGNNIVSEKAAPGISEANITITPPAHTGHTTRSQQRYSIKAEEGSVISWNLSATGNPGKISILFNDSTSIELKPATNPGVGESKNFLAKKTLTTNGYYQVKIDDQLSEMYQLEIIPDQQPVITVQTPRPSTIIDYGQSQQVPLSVSISDDYGIASSSIVTTIASGSGEAVKFTEQKTAFDNFKAGNTKYALSKTFSLGRMGMKPGDELYFYISAIDNNRQETRSDVYIIRIEDTAALMSIDGIMSGVDVKPEFFRSQRQIIIETEQLLKGRDTMTAQAFKDRSNALGMDQKLLRLRYGKFLGEESETNIGEDGHDDHEHEGGEHHEDKDGHEEEIAIEDFNNAEKLIDRYAHKHDIAEDATFFDPQTKTDLRAVLAEMWKAELQLRTYKTKDALPFEYKALRLLKDLQQKSREYVAKTTTKTTPLKPEKRLTGELDKVVETSRKAEYTTGPDKISLLRKALAVLNETRDAKKQSFTEAELEIISQVAGELSLKAGAEPAAYLKAFQEAKKLARNEAADIVVVEKAMQRLLRSAEILPAAGNTSGNSRLSEYYFMNLNKSGRR